MEINKLDCKIIDLQNLSIREARIKMREELFKRDYKILNKKDLLIKYHGVRNKEQLIKESVDDTNNKPLYFILPYVPKRKTFKHSGFEKIITRCPYCGSNLKISNGLTVCSGDNLLNIKKTLRYAIASYGIVKAGYLLREPYKRFLDEYFNQGYLDCNFCMEIENERFHK